MLSQNSKDLLDAKFIGKNNLILSPFRKQVGGIFGIGATSFLEFKVTTEALGWEVGRRYSDFTWLRNYLLKVYPTHVIPPVP